MDEWMMDGWVLLGHLAAQATPLRLPFANDAAAAKEWRVCGNTQLSPADGAFPRADCLPGLGLLFLLFLLFSLDHNLLLILSLLLLLFSLVYASPSL